MMETIPAELLELKTRFDQWRKKRQHIREPIPVELRQAALKISQRYQPSFVRRLLKIDPWRLNRAASQKPARVTSRKKAQATFFHWPAEPVSLPAPSPILNATDCRLQLERPDGSRLTLTLPALDLNSTRQLCDDFLQGGTQ
jgi:hypothetical protein